MLIKSGFDISKINFICTSNGSPISVFSVPSKSLSMDTYFPSLHNILTQLVNNCDNDEQCEIAGDKICTIIHALQYEYRLMME